MQKRILVTGGAGFIGSHLCEKLLKNGNKVICIDNFYTGSEENINHLLDNPDFELITHDIKEQYYVDVDEIYNLACPASPIHYQNNPIETTKTSVIGAINVLELANRLGCKVLQASTSEVYGDPSVNPQPETYWGNVNTVGIRSCYDEGKRCAETLFMDYHRQNNLKIKIARIFNTYGPRMHPDDGRVIPNFIMQALEGRDITIYGDGMQTRSFQYIDDLIDGLIKLMSTGDAMIDPINIGNPECYTITEIARKITKMTGSNSKIIYLPPLLDDPKQRQPVIDNAIRLLDWRPSVELNEGLVRTIEYYMRVVLEKSEISILEGKI